MKEYKQTLVVIIVLNYIDYKLTKKCVENLLKIGIKYQIIVVDNNSPNNSYIFLKETFGEIDNVLVVKSEKNGGYSYGNNYGIKIANTVGKFENICIMNPDVILEENFFVDMCMKLGRKEDYAIISGMMFLNNCLETDHLTWKLPQGKDIYRDHFLLNRKKLLNCRYKYIENGLVEAETLPGSFFIIKKDIFEKIGYFDENVFLYNEENILALKLKEKNYKIVLDVNHYYLHNHVNKTSKNIKEKYKNDFQSIFNNYYVGYQSRKYLCKTYYEGKYLNHLKLIHLLNMMILYLKHIFAIMFW